MTSQGFSFPPPPPPPPPTNQTFSQNTTQNYTSSRGRGRGRGNTDNRGGWRGVGTPNRGRGGFQGHAGGNQNYGPGNYSNGYNNFGRGGYNNAPGAAGYGSFAQAQLRPGTASYSQPSTSHNKRPYSAAFPNHPPTTRPQAAPAVPSFGQPLPIAPLSYPGLSTPSFSSSEKPIEKSHRKHPRKHNQLGLTPAKEEHESSASGSDADEETTFATGDASTALEISYRGKTSTLKTAADVAAWIEERKKNFPTRERVEARKKEEAERKKKYEEAKQARYEAVKAQRLERQQARQSGKQEAPATSQNHPDSAAIRGVSIPRKRGIERQSVAKTDSTEAVTKAKLKAEKLRKRALKAEEAVKKAEVAALAVVTEKTQFPADSSGIDSIPTTTSPHLESNTTNLGILEETIDLPDLENIPSSDSDLDDVDDTTSSGSSPSDSDNESDSNASSTSLPPETLSTKPSEHPPRIPPPTRLPPKSLKPCHKFRSTGRCPKGDRCRYSHDLSSSQSRDPTTTTTTTTITTRQKNNGVKKSDRKTKGLYQILMEKQEDEDRKLVLRSILALGKMGLLKNGDDDGEQQKEKGEEKVTG